MSTARVFNFDVEFLFAVGSDLEMRFLNVEDDEISTILASLVEFVGGFLFERCGSFIVTCEL